MTAARILVVQDNRVYAQRTLTLLKCAQYEVSALTSPGEETIRLAGSCRPDLVLLDIPEDAIHDTAALILHVTSRFDIPVLCLVGYGDHEILEQLTVDEPVAYVLKPYEEMELLTGVRTALRYHGAFLKRVGAVVRKSEDQFRNVFEYAPVGKALVGLDGRLLKVNRALWELTGYPEHELTTRMFQDIIVPDDEQQGLDPLRQMLRGENRIYQTEGRCLHKQGHELRVLLNFSPMSEGGRSSRYIILQVLDITMRKRAEEALCASEQRYRKLVEATTSYIYTVAVQNGVPGPTNHEEGCFFVTGYTADEYAASPALWYQMVYEADRKDVIKQANAVLSGQTSAPLEHRIVHKEGSILWVRNTPVPHFDEQGRLVSYDGLITNITEERKLKEQLHQAQKMEAVGQLAGGIAHDFNNVLTSIIGYATVLGMKLDEDDGLSRDVAHILNATERAAVLTKRLLAFSRKQSINPAAVKVNDVVQRVAKLLSRVIGEDIQLKNVLTENEVTIMADSWQLEQVLINLATNARDAMPDGGLLAIETGSIWLDADFIRVHGYGEVGPYARITVADTGTGMDEGTQKRVFEPFFTTKEVGKGTGLGLAIVYGIVKQHRGYITVYSEPGRGTTFTIYLPVVCAVVEDAAGMVAPMPVHGRETVLLAEDDEYVRLSTRTLLENYGYRVIEASEGDDAISKYRHHRGAVDLLILDVVMPNKTGKEVYEEIKKLDPGVKVLFTSGYTEEIVRRKGIPDQGVNFISKPISPAIFSRKIRDVLAA